MSPAPAPWAAAGALALAVLAGAPAALSIHHGLCVAVMWAVLRALAAMAYRGARRLLDSDPAACMAATIVCTSAVAALALLAPLAGPEWPRLPPEVLMLLALASVATAHAPPGWQPRELAAATLIFVAVGAARSLLPPMAADASAALGLALLAALLALWPTLQSAEDRRS